MTKAAVTPLYVRMADAPAMFGLSRDTLERRAKEGAITIRKRGAASLLSVAEVQAWIDQGAQAPNKVGAKSGASDGSKT